MLRKLSRKVAHSVRGGIFVITLVQPQQTRKKTRIVFDSAALFKGAMQGLDMINNLLQQQRAEQIRYHT